MCLFCHHCIRAKLGALQMLKSSPWYPEHELIYKSDSYRQKRKWTVLEYWPMRVKRGPLSMGMHAVYREG